MKKISVRTIAQELSLSPSAVSLALNGKPGVSEQTRIKVLDYAHSIGYSVQKQKSPQIIQLAIYKKHGGVVAAAPFFENLIEQTTHVAAQNGYHLNLSYFYESQDMQEQINSLQSIDIAGCLLLATEMYSRDILPFRSLTMPLVVLDSYFPDETVDCVSINNAYGARHAVRYLQQNGHTDIGYIASGSKIRNFTERAEGFCRATNRSLGSLQSNHRFIKLMHTSEGAFHDMCNYLAHAVSLPTAFFAEDDLLAISVVRALQRFGYRVPQDISVVGFDDISTASLCSPPLTTMAVSRSQLGSAAIERLLARIHGDAQPPLWVQVSTHLVERESVAKL